MTSVTLHQSTGIPNIVTDIESYNFKFHSLIYQT